MRYSFYLFLADEYFVLPFYGKHVTIGGDDLAFCTVLVFAFLSWC